MGRHRRLAAPRGAPRRRLARWPSSSLLAGTLLLDPPAGTGIGVGELLILAATLLWTGETILARRLLPRVGAGRGAAARMAIGSIVLLGIVAWSGGLAGVAAWTPDMWGFVAVTAVLLAGYVAAWYGALERAPASVVTSVLVVGALITATLRAVAAGAPPDRASPGRAGPPGRWAPASPWSRLVRRPARRRPPTEA